jgi:hypothetical protein
MYPGKKSSISSLFDVLNKALLVCPRSPLSRLKVVFFFKVDARYLSRIFACSEDSLQDYSKQKFFFPNSDKRSEAI